MSFTRSGACAVAVALFACVPVAAAEAQGNAAPATSANVTGYYYALPDEADFGVGVASVNHGPLRFEARYNYEIRGGASAFVGWKFSGGDTVTWELTPIAGGLFGAGSGFVPGFEASLAYRAVDVYVEAEYVPSQSADSAAYYYAWSELGWRPVEWLRVGLVGQRTRTVASDRELQRGVFGQASAGKATLSVYAFNPDDSSRYFIVSLGAQF